MGSNDCSEIPVIDFGPFLNGSIEDQKRVADEISHACRNIGVYYLKNHSISQDLLNRTFDEVKRFFQLPMEEKKKLTKDWTRAEIGYTPPFEELVVNIPDYKEVFDFMRELPPNDEYLQMEGADHYRGNQWPETLPSLRAVLYDEYVNSAVALCDSILEAYALSFKLPKDHFKPITRKPLCQFRVAYYPALPTDSAAEQMSCGEHTDHEAVTIIAQQDDVNGLQVKNKQGDWIDVIPIAGTMVVLVGDVVGRWSNGHFKPPVHRVITRSGKDRYSLLTFHMPDYHSIIECCMKDEVPKHPPIKSGEFRKMVESSYH